MKNFFRKNFALTETGAGDLIKSTITSFIVYVSNMLPAMLLMYFLDELLMGHARSATSYIALSLIGVIIMGVIFRIDYDAMYNSTYRESANLRLDIAETLGKMPLSYFSKHDLSDLAQTIMSDVAALEHAISHAIGKTIGFAIYFPLVSLLLIMGNVKLGLAVMMPIILSFLLIMLSKRIQLKENLKYFKKLRDNSESFQEAIENQQEIKSFGMVDEVRRNLYKKMEESEKIHLKAEIMVGIPLILSGVIGHMALAVVIIVGMQLYMAGETSVLYVVGYLMAAMKIKDGFDGLSQNVAEIFYLDAMINRIKEIRNTPVQEGKEEKIDSYEIELKDVTFSYNDDAKVIRGVGFTANPGEVTALVGMSGCGKTSLLRLISRLYDYDGGSIKIGRKDIKRISTDSLFEKISIVFQDVTLFNTSVLENIRIGRSDASDEEVMEAAKLANCHEFVEKLPDKYNTPIGENGATLSGGERQRISIARAFLKDAPIIILDEIAASLDVNNEKKIQESLNRLIHDKTVIIISHRMKSIENADKIVVMKDGKVEASGSHRELITVSETYKNLVEKARLAEEFSY